jgi:hypothetical protein
MVQLSDRPGLSKRQKTTGPASGGNGHAAARKRKEFAWDPTTPNKEELI